jgi:hypothetical protein
MPSRQPARRRRYGHTPLLQQFFRNLFSRAVNVETRMAL